MDCSWSDVMHSVGYEFSRPDSKRVLAFVYTATIGLRVEQSCIGINPCISMDELEQCLTRAPDWVGRRKEWLKGEWPGRQVRNLTDLKYYGMISSKAHLAPGAKIPDGSYAEMLGAFESLFPE